MKGIRILLRALPVAFGLMVVIGVGTLALVRVGRTVEAPGEVRVYRYDVVRSRVPGIVTAVRVEPGEEVAAGQTVFELRDYDLERQAIEVRTELHEAQARRLALQQRRRQLRDEIQPLEASQRLKSLTESGLEEEVSASRSRELELELQRAKESFGRLEDLHEAGLISAQELSERRFETLQVEERYRQGQLEARLADERVDNAADSLRLLRAEHRSSLAEVEAELEQVALLIEQLTADRNRLAEISGHYEVRAESGGVMVGDPVNDLVGRRVQPGDELAYVLDPSSVHFVTYVPEAAILKVRTGQDAFVELAGLPKRAFDVFEGEVQKVGARPDAEQGETASLYPVEIRLRQPWVMWDGDRTYVRGGMRGRAKIAYQEDVSVLRAIYETLVGEPGPAPVDVPAS